MKAGDLVRWRGLTPLDMRGSIGIIIHEYSSKIDMVWVKWNNQPKRALVEESRLEVLNESR